MASCASRRKHVLRTPLALQRTHGRSCGTTAEWSGPGKRHAVISDTAHCTFFPNVSTYFVTGRDRMLNPLSFAGFLSKLRKTKP